ncbi:MAG TPA: response regulator [Candidatus Lokiarchaeia archaeon]|nr:response regulator [Candidatus Lokiarchaeia archaeon]
MRSPSILVVEDDPEFAILLREAFRETSSATQLYVAPNGAAALEFLEQASESAEPPCPDLILLDLHLPGLDGKGVLQEIKARGEWQAIPVIIFTGSGNPREIAKCYELGASDFITKPPDYYALLEIVHNLAAAWLPDPEAAAPEPRTVRSGQGSPTELN